MQGVTREDYDYAVKWMSDNSEQLPERMIKFLSTMLDVYWKLIQPSQKALETLKYLRQLMRITPKSERGSQEKY
jgi:hypothetical protein